MSIAEQQRRRRSKERRLIAVVGIAAIFFAALVAGGFWLLQGGGTSSFASSDHAAIAQWLNENTSNEYEIVQWFPPITLDNVRFVSGQYFRHGEQPSGAYGIRVKSRESALVGKVLHDQFFVMANHKIVGHADMVDVIVNGDRPWDD